MTAPASLTMPSSVALRLRCLTPKIYELGEKPLFELLCTIAAESTAAIDAIERYAGLSRYSELIQAFGGRDLPPHLWRIK